MGNDAAQDMSTCPVCHGEKLVEAIIGLSYFTDRAVRSIADGIYGHPVKNDKAVCPLCKGDGEVPTVVVMQMRLNESCHPPDEEIGLRTMSSHTQTRWVAD